MPYLMVSKKKITFLCEDGIEKSVPCDHGLASLVSRVMPNGDHEGQIFRSHTRDEFLFSWQSISVVNYSLDRFNMNAADFKYMTVTL